MGQLKSLNEKWHGLPKWVWGIGLAIILFLAYRWYQNRSSSTATPATNTATTPSDTTSGYPYGSGDSGSGGGFAFPTQPIASGGGTGDQTVAPTTPTEVIPPIDITIPGLPSNPPPAGGGSSTAGGGSSTTGKQSGGSGITGSTPPLSTAGQISDIAKAVNLAPTGTSSAKVDSQAIISAANAVAPAKAPVTAKTPPPNVIEIAKPAAATPQAKTAAAKAIKVKSI